MIFIKFQATEVGKCSRARIATVLVAERAHAISAAVLASAALETRTMQMQVARQTCLPQFSHLERLVSFVFLIRRKDFILISSILHCKIYESMLSNLSKRTAHAQTGPSTEDKSALGMDTALTLSTKDRSSAKCSAKTT